MLFNINIGLASLTNAQAEDSGGKTYALFVGDTVIVSEVREREREWRLLSVVSEWRPGRHWSTETFSLSLSLSLSLSAVAGRPCYRTHRHVKEKDIQYCHLLGGEAVN